jgi:hypothetical protein
MAMPLAGRVAAAVAGGLLVLAAVSSVTVTLIVSRAAKSRLTRWVDRTVDWAYEQVAVRVGDYRRRDQLRATQAAAVLLAQLAAWLIVAYVGFALLLWPFAARGVASAFVDAGSSLFTLGFAVPAGTAPAVIVFLAAATGLVILTLQIAYLDTMPDLYARWESWAADVAESHTTYPVLVRFRSPGPLSSWVTALLAVLDSAALFLALSPEAAPVVPARLCLRGGFRCFNRIARVMGFDIPEEPGRDAETTLTYAEFLEAVGRMREVGFPIERDPAEAWPDFVGWRVNYEQAAYAVAAAVYAVPALWSGPRRLKVSPIAPSRPGRGNPPK